MCRVENVVRRSQGKGMHSQSHSCGHRSNAQQIQNSYRPQARRRAIAHPADWAQASRRLQQIHFSPREMEFAMPW